MSEIKQEEYKAYRLACIAGTGRNDIGTYRLARIAEGSDDNVEADGTDETEDSTERLLDDQLLPDLPSHEEQLWEIGCKVSVRCDTVKR